MEFYRYKSRIWELFEQAQIHSLIAPFGFSTPYPKFDFKEKCRIICRPDFVEKCKGYNAEIRTSPRMHSKLAVGFYGVLFGSFNFTNTRQKELVAYSNKPKDIEDALSEFDFWWQNARGLK